MTDTVKIPTPPLGWVTFRSYAPTHRFTCRLGDGSPTITSGGGGWEVTKRPRRQSLVEWNGSDPMKIDIPILFDDFRSNQSVEGDIISLEYMWGIGEDGGEPPLLAFNSGGVIPHDQHDAPTHDWVVDDVSWGDADRNEYGNRVRQAATVTVMLFVEDNVLSDQSAAQRRAATQAAKRQAGKTGKKRSAKHKTHTVRSGETLSSIAKEEYGDASRWHDIATKNGIRDPKSIKRNQVLKLP